MPKIDAPTVAEHHQRRRADLLAAAEELLITGGIDAVTLGAVGTACGLARSSVYQYFDSSPALLAALVEDAFPRATQRLSAAVSHEQTAQARVETFVFTALRMAAEPEHRALYALARLDLPPECRSRLADLHDQQYAPLRQALTDLGLNNPALTCRLVIGLLAAAVQAVESGSPPQAVERELMSILREGLHR